MTTIPQYDSPDITLVAAATIGAFIRVKIDSNGRSCCSNRCRCWYYKRKRCSEWQVFALFICSVTAAKYDGIRCDRYRIKAILQPLPAKVDDADPGSAHVVGVAL